MLASPPFTGLNKISSALACPTFASAIICWLALVLQCSIEISLNQLTPALQWQPLISQSQFCNIVLIFQSACLSWFYSVTVRVLKSGCKPMKKPATELDWHQLQLDCSCQSGGWAIGVVAVAIARPMIKKPVATNFLKDQSTGGWCSKGAWFVYLWWLNSYVINNSWSKYSKMRKMSTLSKCANWQGAHFACFW